jgi:hypothetical protein
MSKLFYRWPGDRTPYAMCKYGHAQIIAIRTAEDDLFCTAGGTITEVYIRWIFREKPRFRSQFRIRFSGGTETVEYLVDQDAGSLQVFRGPGITGCKELTLLANPDTEKQKGTWAYSDDRGYFTFTKINYEQSTEGPVISGAYCKFKYIGTHYFLEPGEYTELGAVVYDTENGKLGAMELPNTGTSPTAAGLEGNFGLPVDYVGANRRRKAYGDRFIEVYMPPPGATPGYRHLLILGHDLDENGQRIRGYSNHVWTFMFLFSHTVKLPLCAIDYGRPLPLVDSPVPDADTVPQIGEAALGTGFYVGKVQ